MLRGIQERRREVKEGLFKFRLRNSGVLVLEGEAPYLERECERVPDSFVFEGRVYVDFGWNAGFRTFGETTAIFVEGSSQNPQYRISQRRDVSKEAVLKVHREDARR